jgi:hypothetical protein
VTPATPNVPYLTGTGLARSLNCTPLQQGRVVDELRRQRVSPRPFNPWSRLCGAIRQDLRFRTGHQRLQAVVDQPPANLGARYRELAPGWRRFLATLGGPTGMGEAKLSTAITVHSGLTINLNPQVGLLHPDGHVEVIHLWFDNSPLADHTAQALLYLMQTNISTLHSPDATACVLDLHTATAHRLPAGWQRARGLDGYVNGHAARVVALWNNSDGIAA